MYSSSVTKRLDMKGMKIVGYSALVAGVAAGGFAIYQYFKPINAFGPFTSAKQAFIRSEDGKYTIATASIQDGSLVEEIGGKEVFNGKILRLKKNGYKLKERNGNSLTCLTVNESKAICGAVRYQKPHGQFAFDKKIPFTVRETLFYGPFSGGASENKSIMFKSSDGSLWIKSRKAGTYRFISPNKFMAEWTDNSIYWGSLAYSGKGGYGSDLKPRKAECDINKDSADVSVLCNGSAGTDRRAIYSSIWTFLDQSDSADPDGKIPNEKIMDSHD